MKLKTSFFNPGMAKSLLKRFWPLWLGWLVLLIVLLPVSTGKYISSNWNAGWVNSNLIDCAVISVYLSAGAAVLSTMAVFSHMFNRRDCGLINSLPVRRECAFVTSAIVGLVPLLAAELVTYLITLALYGSYENFSAQCLNQWLYAALLGTLAFYGIAVLCTMFTGNVFGVPVLFLAVNLFAAFAETLIYNIFDALIYGYVADTNHLLNLAPLAKIDSVLYARTPINTSGAITGLPYMQGLDILGIYAVVGVLLLPIALLFYRKRQMEAAGDFIAVSFLRPVFKYCASFCAALLFEYVVYEMSFGRELAGTKAAVVIALLLLVGAVIGFYAAQMLLDKTVNVFRRTKAWGLLIMCVLLLGLVAGCKMDITGYESYIPDTEDIQSVRVFKAYPEILLDDEASIDLYRQIHQTILDNKSRNENADGYYSIYLVYHMKDGSTVERSYSVDCSVAWVDSGASELPLVQQFCKLPAVTQANTASLTPISAENISYAYVYANGDVYNYTSCYLTVQQAEELYNQCILPDMEDSSLGELWAYRDAEYAETVSNVELDMTVAVDFEPDGSANYRYVDMKITMDAKRTLAWLEENLSIEAVPYSQINDMSDREYYSY